MSGETRDIANYSNAVLIGRGGFAWVYQATDVAHDRQVAIKVLRTSMGAAERRRFDRERQTMGRLGSHPNIIPVHDSGYTEAGEAYIVMELAGGGSLRKRLDETGRLPWPEAVEIMATVASAIQAAHDSGVLHRDIKPDNILIDQYGHPKLSDFGIATVADNATATTSTSTTLAHAAPEVLQGQKSTGAVDVYALGSTLHALISGSPPFMRPDDEVAAAMLMRVLGEPPPDLRPFGVPDPLARVIEQALAKEPAQRQGSAAELSSQLRAMAQPGSTSGAAPTTQVAAPLHNPNVHDDAAVPHDGPTVSQVPSSQHGPNTEVLATTPTTVGWGNRLLVLGVVVSALVGLGVLAMALGDRGQDDATTSTLGPDPASPATQLTQSQTSEPQTAQPPTTEPQTTLAPTTSTTAPLVARDLAVEARATVPSSANPGVDACGNDTTYGAANLLDGDQGSTWRTSGDGAGLSIEIDLGGVRRVSNVGLIPGYAKRDACDGTDRFLQNRRIEEVRWTIGGQSFVQQFNSNLARMQEIDLRDLPEGSTVRLEILRTTEAGGRDFTAISEISIRGG